MDHAATCSLIPLVARGGDQKKKAKLVGWGKDCLTE